jgi:hypothetical protein
MCVQFFTKEGLKKTSEKIRDHERTIIKILALLLGFYASTLMRRWWGQVSKLPRLNDVAMVMNAIFQPGINYAKLIMVFLVVEFLREGHKITYIFGQNLNILKGNYCTL